MKGEKLLLDLCWVMAFGGFLWICISLLPIITYYSSDPSSFLGQDCLVTARTLAGAKIVFGFSCSALFLGVVGYFIMKYREPAKRCKRRLQSMRRT